MQKLLLSICLINLAFVSSFGQISENYTPQNSEEAEMVETLSKYIQFESVTGQETQAGLWLKELCETNGFFTKQMGTGESNFNFSASLYPLSKGLPNIIFLHHIDVVPAENPEIWTHPPFSGTVTETEIWGRGSYDNKGVAVMQLYSMIDLLKSYGDKDMPYNVTLLSVSCEEGDCGENGVEHVVNNYLEELNPIVVFGEGPFGIREILSKTPETPVFGISTAHKKFLWLELELSIKSFGHASVTPEFYSNKEMVIALNKVLNRKPKLIFNDVNTKMLKALGRLESGLTKFALKHPKTFKGLIKKQLRKEPELFSIFSNTLTLTGISCNTNAINTIPEKVTATLDCRLLPGESTEDFIADLRKRLKNDDIKINIVGQSHDTGFSNEHNIFYNGFQKSIEENYPEGKVVIAMLPNYNDVGAFRAKGVNAYSTVPIIMERKYIERIHSQNERLEIKVLLRGKKTYTDFIEYCFKQGIK